MTKKMDEIRNIEHIDAVEKLKDEIEGEIDRLTDKINELRKQQDSLDDFEEY